MKHKLITFSPQKRLGQNFLIDLNIAKKIASTARIQKDNTVVEIGSGFGGLTKAILPITSNIVLIEKDPILASFLKTEFPNTNILNDDILNVNLEKLNRFGPINLVGNIPYAITSDILFKLIDNKSLISSATLMLQFEVAKRLVAKPKTKDYGILSVQLQAFSSVAFCFKVPRSVFIPKPRVDSAVVHINFHQNPFSSIEFEQTFRRFVRTAFRMRRKTLANNLKGYFPIKNLSESTLSQRAEALSVHEFISLIEQI